MIPERIAIPSPEQPIAIFCVTVVSAASVICGKLGIVIRRNKWLIEALAIGAGRRALGRGEANKLFLRVGSERVLVARAGAVGGARRVLNLLEVTEDNEEEESGDAKLNEECDNVTPRTPVPGVIAPCCSIVPVQRGACYGTPDSPTIEDSVSGGVSRAGIQEGSLLGKVEDNLNKTAGENAERS
jgi:hypothetical protein